MQLALPREAEHRARFFGIRLEHGFAPTGGQGIDQPIAQFAAKLLLSGREAEIHGSTPLRCSSEIRCPLFAERLHAFLVFRREVSDGLGVTFELKHLLKRRIA